MELDYENIHNWFLSSASIDYISLDEICGKMTTEANKIPNQREFNSAMQFILFLSQKYKKSFIYVKGPDMKAIEMNCDELINWLKYEYQKGNYNKIDYGVWFGLDESVIPKEYLPNYEE